MQEAFLHFVWQHQYFNKTGLSTAGGKPVSVIKPGFHNSDSGPDFSEARVKIDTLDWRGNVEIHNRSSDWDAHGHTRDKAYDSVILHVVWDHDSEIRRNDGTEIPTLILKDRVDPALLDKYHQLINHVHDIPCENQLAHVDGLITRSMLDTAAMERLSEKSGAVLSLLKKNGNDWEETAYQLVCKNFGFKTNSDQFLGLAERLPFKVLAKHSDKIHQLEALLFGQAGFLEGAPDEYSKKLLDEYNFLYHKYQLKPPLSHHQWKFMRLRPANFPTLRIAQLAGTLSDPKGLFSRFLQVESRDQLLRTFEKSTSRYWNDHYLFGKKTMAKVNSIGAASIENIGINTVAPILVAYGKTIDEQHYVDQAVTLLQELAAEGNKKTRLWKKCGLQAQSALDSQGMIQLYDNYCLRKRCLDCKIGVSIVRKPQEV